MKDMYDKKDLARIARRINDINRQERAANEKRREHARREALRLAETFAERDAGLRRVLLFGSTVGNGSYRADSDIDLAVEGGDLSVFIALAEDSPFKVDVVDMNDLHAGFKALIERSGVVLYSRGKYP